MSVRFSQSCPTCGRRMEVRASLLGRTIACQHCRAEFTATAHQDIAGQHGPEDDLMRRVEEALRKSQAAAASARAGRAANASVV